MKKRLFLDPLSRNIGCLSLLVLVLSLQVLIVLVFVYQFIPLKMAPITEGVPPTLLKLFQPNRNHFFYHVFILVAMAGQACALYLYRKRLSFPELAGEISEFLMAEVLWVSWQLFAVFKILQYDNPPWARILLYTGFAAAVLSKVFWPELKRGFKYFQWCLQGNIPTLWRMIADGGIILFLFLTIMIPDVEKALLRVAFADNNTHFDQWLMAPLWAYHKGLMPTIQFFEPLNGGVLVLVHAAVGLIGGVTYAHVVTVLCLLTVVYYIVFYYFLRSWLGILSALFGVLLAVKLQMFHMGMNPLVWVYPSQSVLRHCMDIVVFFCVLLFAQGRGELFLWLAFTFLGISLALVFDTGMYMLGGLYFYLAALLLFKDTRSLLCPNPRQWRKILGLVLLPWVFMVMALTICFGPIALKEEFWMERLKDIPRWLTGVDAVSIYSCLRDRNFFAFFASFVPPVMYAMGVMITIRMVYLRRWGSEKLILLPLSIYGLGVYAHFLWHASINEYYMVPLPLVGCLCFWLSQYSRKFDKSRQRVMGIILVLVTAGGLLTNFLFTHYPNVFNIAGDSWDEQKAFYRANYHFDNDTRFVRDLTLPDQRVPLISGFETQILVQTNRASFFYHSLTLMNQSDVQELVDQLDKGKPTQVFINKRFLNGTGIEILTGYLKAHYQYKGQESEHLILLKRNHE